MGAAPFALERAVASAAGGEGGSRALEAERVVWLGWKGRGRVVENAAWWGRVRVRVMVMVCACLAVGLRRMRGVVRRVFMVEGCVLGEGSVVGARERWRGEGKRFVDGVDEGGGSRGFKELGSRMIEW